MTTLYLDLLEPFVKATYYRVYRFAYNMIAHRPTTGMAAEDITQGAYERLLIKLNHDPSMLMRLDKEQMTTYLLSIVRYLGYELSRDSHHFAEIASLHIDQDGDQDIEDSTQTADVEALVLANDAKSNLFRRIRALPERQRTIIELRLEEYSYEEIAARLLISVGAVKTALHRARQNLRIWIKEDDQPETVSCQEEVRSSENAEYAVLSSIEQLPDPYRVVVALHMIKHMSYGDIAQKLHRKVGTVKSQAYRGKQLLMNLQHGHLEKKSVRTKVIADLPARLAYKDQLPDHLRQVVELYYFQSLSCKAVARKLGKAEGTIKGWLRQARRYLQNYTASTSPRCPSEVSRRRHWLPSEKHYELLDRVLLPYRREMKLYYEQSLSITEIARQLELSKSAVKMHLMRGREQLDDMYSRDAKREAM